MEEAIALPSLEHRKAAAIRRNAEAGQRQGNPERHRDAAARRPIDPIRSAIARSSCGLAPAPVAPN